MPLLQSFVLWDFKRACTLLTGKKEIAMREKEREGSRSTKGKGGLYKKNYKFLLSLQSGLGVA